MPVIRVQVRRDAGPCTARASKCCVRGRARFARTVLTAARPGSAQIKDVDHLPKTDMLGTCDPQVEVRMGGKKFKTDYKSNTYRASFTEVFEFDLDALALGDMELELSDHNQANSKTVIGTYVVKASVLQELKGRGNGARQSLEVGVQDGKGARVVGYDKEETQMRVALVYAEKGGRRVSELEQAAEASGHGGLKAEASTRDAFGHRLALQVMITTLEHVPKMDGWLSGGKADPYVEIEYGDQAYQTEPRKNTLRADFNREKFLFQIGEGGEMIFSVWDWDRAGKNELIGRCALGRTTVATISQGGKGKRYSDKLELKNSQGETVVGTDGANTELNIEIEVVEALRDAMGKQAVDQQAEREKEKKQFQSEVEMLRDKEKALVAKHLREQQANAEKLRAIEAQVRKQEEDLRKVKEERDYANEVRSAIKTLLPAAADGNPALRGQYSDLTIECVHGDDPSECIAAHCCVLWATFAGLRPHVEKAYQLKGKKHHVCDVRGDPEMDKLFEFLNADEFKVDDLSADKDKDKDKEGGQQDADAVSYKEHEWNPSHCISVPGTVFGVGYRCTCAHGAFALAVGKSEKKTEEAEEGGGGFVALLRIVGVKPSVVIKVVEIMYGYDMPHFNSDEVLDAILLSRFLKFKRLLIILYQQKHFGDWGCALWDSARIIDAQLVKDKSGAEGPGMGQGDMELSTRWLEELLHDADEHLKSGEGGIFDTDGAVTLTHAGFLFILAHNNANCQEYEMFQAMMAWSRERLRKTEARASEEASKIALQASECALTPGAVADKQLEILKKKKEALDKLKPSWRSIALPMAALIRYPFIAPETLNYNIAMNSEFQKIDVKDKNGLPLVLRAVFHQDGQRMPGWNDELNWTPREGSRIYSGEWEWLYGPAAMHKDKDGLPHWPVQPNFLELDFPFATENEITDLGLTKLEVFNLDNDGDGDPDVEDILLTFRYCVPMAGTKETANAAVQNAIHHEDMSYFEKIKETTQAMMGRAPAKAKLTKEKFMRAARKIALGTKAQRGFSHAGPERRVFAVGRVRPSALHAGGAVVGGRRLRERSDQRLYGRGFIILESRREAYDVKLRFENKPFLKQSREKDEWVPLKGEHNLTFKISGPEAIVTDLQQKAQGKLEFKVVCCMNLPRTDFGAALGIGKTDAFVVVKYDGNQFQTQPIKNSLDPQFNQTFDLSILQLADPGKISLTVSDWDRFSKNDAIGGCEVSSKMLAVMCQQREGEEELALVDASNAPVMGANKQASMLRFSWRFSEA